MKRRVLFVIDSLACGGAEKSLVSLLPLLDYDKMTVDLLVVRRGGLFERYVPSEVRIVALPVTCGVQRVLHGLGRLCFSLWLRAGRLFGLKRHSAEVRWMTMGAATAPMREHYDVAVAYQQGFPTYYVADKVSAERRYAWVNIDLEKAGYREEFNRRFYDRFDAVTAVSQTLHTMLAGSGYVDASKLCTVYDILNTEIIARMSLEHGFDDELGEGVLRIVTAGRMTAQKNYALAVETAKLLRDAGLHFRWYFVGDGGERRSVERLVAEYGLGEQVMLLGMQSNPYPYMAGCDVYVQTSNFEGFCLTLREARILNRPVVSTDFSVVGDQIRDGENGLVARMTPESVAEKIMMLADDEALRGRLMEATRMERDTTMLTEAVKVNKMLLGR